jgi:hypothetical protein
MSSRDRTHNLAKQIEPERQQHGGGGSASYGFLRCIFETMSKEAVLRPAIGKKKNTLRSSVHTILAIRSYAPHLRGRKPATVTYLSSLDHQSCHQRPYLQSVCKKQPTTAAESIERR